MRDDLPAAATHPSAFVVAAGRNSSITEIIREHLKTGLFEVAFIFEVGRGVGTELLLKLFTEGREF